MKIFAGDQFYRPADASYKNLFWENLPHEYTQIGTIDSWGPFFRVSFDLIIHSHNNDGEHFGVLAFRGNGGTSDCCENGDRIPFITVVSSNQELLLSFANSVNKNGNYWFNHNIKLETWYNIIIEQDQTNRMVSQRLHLLFHLSPRTEIKIIVILRLTIELKLMENLFMAFELIF